MTVKAIRFVVPGRPVPMPRARIVLGREWPHGYVPAAARRAQERIACAFLAAQSLAGMEPTVLASWEGPVFLSIVALWRCKAGGIKERAAAEAEGQPRCARPDWDNVGKLVSDALSGIAYEDDAQVDALVLRRYGPRDELRVTVTYGTLTRAQVAGLPACNAQAGIPAEGEPVR